MVTKLKLIAKSQHNEINYKKVSRFYNNIEPVYSFILNRFYKRDREEVSSYINRNIDIQKDFILDCGCGNASILNFLHSEIKYTGIDISNKSLLKAKRKFPTQNFKCVNVLDYDFPIKYKGIIMSHYLSVSPTSQKDLIKVSEHIANNGFVVIVDHGKSSFIRKITDDLFHFFNLFPGLKFNIHVDLFAPDLLNIFDVILTKRLNFYTQLHVLKKK